MRKTGFVLLVVSAFTLATEATADSQTSPRTWDAVSQCVKQIADGQQCNPEQIRFSEDHTDQENFRSLSIFVASNHQILDRKVAFFGQKSAGSEQYVLMRLETKDHRPSHVYKLHIVDRGGVVYVANIIEVSLDSVIDLIADGEIFEVPFD